MFMTPEPSVPSGNPEEQPIYYFNRVWNISSYLMLAAGLLFCLADPKTQPGLKVLAVLLSAGWAAWYREFVMRRSRLSCSTTISGISYLLAISASVGLSWIQPVFMFNAFTFYGLAYAGLQIRWAVPLVVGLSMAMAWRIAAFSGPVTLNSLPVFVSFLVSAFFSVVLGLYINGIIRQNREKQQMIEALKAARSELAKAERQAGILEERQRLAGEIHDTLAQGFTSVILHLEAADQALNSSPSAARSHIDQARRSARDSLSEARRFIGELRPDVVKHEPLAQAVERVAQRWSEEHNLSACLEVTGAGYPLPAAVEATLLRAAQEALNNVLKHAQASQVNLTLTYLEDEVILDIQDNGAGFDPALLPPQAGLDHGYGLMALQERAAQLGGSLQIESAPGEGTTVVMALPAAIRESEDL